MVGKVEERGVSRGGWGDGDRPCFLKVDLLQLPLSRFLSLRFGFQPPLALPLQREEATPVVDIL
jgi:hypothetical protein